MALKPTLLVVLAAAQGDLLSGIGIPKVSCLKYADGITRDTVKCVELCKASGKNATKSSRLTD